MVTLAELAEWGRAHGFPDLRRRVTDTGWAFLVNPLPPDLLALPEAEQPIGWGPIVVVKSTREVWQFHSADGPIFCAGTEAEFTEALRAAPFPHTPTGRVPPGG